jgi:mono/diheme cytochrome c family protein
MRVRVVFVSLTSAIALVLALGGATLLAGAEKPAPAGAQSAEAGQPKASGAGQAMVQDPQPAQTEPGTAGDGVEAGAAEAEKPYTVVCETVGGRRECKVDQQTFAGWRTFHGFCVQCHAQDAVGSTFAPSLLARMPNVDRERFEQVVANGFTGQMGVMPSFKDNPNVMPQIDELYAYLRARADGALPPGRPPRLPREE